MSQCVDFEKAKDMIIEMEEMMCEIFPQWEDLSNDAKQYVTLRYWHITFAFLAKEKHDIHLEFSASSEDSTLHISTGQTTFVLTRNDRTLIDHSQLIWAAMPVVPNGSMTLTFDNTSEAMRFECSRVWENLQAVYSDALLLHDNFPTEVLECTYVMIPVDGNGNDYPED